MAIFIISPISKTCIFRVGVHVRLNLAQKTDFRFLRGTYDAVNKRYVPETSYESAESHLTLQILKKGDVFFDIGSNWGYYSFLASVAVGNEGLVVAIECASEPFKKLNEMVCTMPGLSNILPFNTCLSNINGDKVSINNTWWEDYTGSYIKKSNLKNAIGTKTLDVLWSQLGKPRVKMIKIDTEGSEYLVLMVVTNS